MRNAPSVTYPVGRSFWGAAFGAALWLAGALAVAAWCLHGSGPAWRAPLGAAVLAFTGAWAGWRWLRSFDGQLGWDGGAWHAAGPGPAIDELSCVLDLQVALLLRSRAGGSIRWFWVERSRAPGRWRELRRAVYSRARPDALGGAMPPTAKP